MSLLDTFTDKLAEYATNNIRALEGHIQVTSNERDDLLLLFRKLEAADKAKALELAKARGVDVSSWK